MARRVGDLRLGLEILAGPHPRDPYSTPAPLVGPALEKPIRVALVTHPAGGTTAREIRESVRGAGAALEASGYRVEEMAPPMVEQAIETWGRWLAWELTTMSPVLHAVMSADANRFFDAFLALFGTPTYERSVEIMRTRHQIARAWSAFFADYPIIVGPTWCEPQFAHGYDIAGPTSAADIVNLIRFVTPMNLLGLPVVCVPTGIAAGLPMGVQVIADRFREDVCLDAAAAIEERLGTFTPIDVGASATESGALA